MATTKRTLTTAPATKRSGFVAPKVEKKVAVPPKKGVATAKVAEKPREMATGIQFQQQFFVNGTLSILKPHIDQCVKQGEGDISKLNLSEVANRIGLGPKVVSMEFKEYKSAVKLTSDERIKRANAGEGCRRVMKGNGAKNLGGACGEKVAVGNSKITGKKAIFCSKCISRTSFPTDPSVIAAIEKSGLSWSEATAGSFADQVDEEEEEEENADEEEDNEDDNK